MSTRYTHDDVVEQTATSILTARRLRALKAVLIDESNPAHAELVAVADMLISTDDEAPRHEFDLCCICDRPGAPWDGAEYCHETCMTRGGS